MKQYIFLLIFIPIICFSQSGISISGSSQFNIGESVLLINNVFEPQNYEQRHNSVTVSIFRGRKFKIGTIVLKGELSYNIENTTYYNTEIETFDLGVIDEYEIITRN